MKAQVCAVVSRPPRMMPATSACSKSPDSGFPAARLCTWGGWRLRMGCQSGAQLQILRRVRAFQAVHLHPSSRSVDQSCKEFGGLAASLVPLQ